MIILQLFGRLSAGTFTQVGRGVSYNLGYRAKLGLVNNPISISVDNLGVADIVRMNNPTPSEPRMTNLIPNLS